MTGRLRVVPPWPTASVAPAHEAGERPDPTRARNAPAEADLLVREGRAGVPRLEVVGQAPSTVGPLTIVRAYPPDPASWGGIRPARRTRRLTAVRSPPADFREVGTSCRPPRQSRTTRPA